MHAERQKGASPPSSPSLPPSLSLLHRAPPAPGRADDGNKEILHAFTACGGKPDGSGFVKCDRVVHVVKEIFKLHFDIK